MNIIFAIILILPILVLSHEIQTGKKVRNLIDDQNYNIFSFCNQYIQDESQIPQEIKDLTQKELFYSGEEIYFKFDQDCQNTLPQNLNIYLVLNHTDSQYTCEIPQLILDGECASYSPDIYINTITYGLDGEEQEIYEEGTEYAILNKIFIQIYNANSLEISNLQLQQINLDTKNQIQLVLSQIVDLKLNNFIIKDQVINQQKMIYLHQNENIAINNIQILNSQFGQVDENGQTSCLFFEDFNNITIQNIQVQNIFRSNPYFEIQIFNFKNGVNSIDGEQKTGEITIKDVQATNMEGQLVIFFFSDLDKITIDGLIFSDLFITEFYFIYIQDVSYFTLDNFSISNSQFNSQIIFVYQFTNSNKEYIFNNGNISEIIQNDLSISTLFALNYINSITIMNTNVFHSDVSNAIFGIQISQEVLIQNMKLEQNYGQTYSGILEVIQNKVQLSVFDIYSYNNTVDEGGALILIKQAVGNTIFNNIKSYNTERTLFVINNFNQNQEEETKLQIINSIFDNTNQESYKSTGVGVFIQNTIGQYGKEFFKTDIQIENCQFLSQYSTSSGGSLYIQGSRNLLIHNSSFQGSSSFYEGGSIYIKNLISDIVIKDVNITQSSSFRGSAIFMYNITNFLLQDSYINDTIANVEAAIYGIENINQGNIIIQNTTFSNNTAKQRASSIYFQNQKQIYFKNLILESQFIKEQLAQTDQGSSIFIDANLIVDPTIQIEKVYIINSASTGSQGIYIRNFKNCQNCEIKNLTFKNLIATQSSNQQVFFLVYATDNLTIQDLIFEDLQENHIFDISQSSHLTLQNINITNFTSKFNQVVSLKESKNIDIINFEVQNVKITQQQAFLVQNSQILNFTSLLFTDITNSFTGPAVLYYQNCVEIFLNDLTVQNAASNKYPALLIEDSENLTFQNSLIQNNQAIHLVGAAKFQNSKNLNLDNIIFQNNYSYKQAGAALFETCKIINIINCTFDSNQGGLLIGAIGFKYSDTISIIKTQITNNIAQNIAGGIYFLQNDNIYINEVNIQNNAVTNIMAGGLYAKQCNNLILNNTNFSDNSGFYGGAIAIIEGQDQYIINNIFKNNKAIYSGGAIYLQELLSLQIQDSTISNNEASSLYGGGIYAEKSNNQLKLINLENKNNYAGSDGGAYYLVDFQELMIENSEFSYNQGSVIYIEAANQADLNNIIIKNSYTGKLGGAIQSINGGNLFLNNVNIEDSSSSEKGGALYLKQQNQVDIQNCQFQQIEVKFYNLELSQALQKTLSQQLIGGAIYAEEITDFSLINSDILNSYSYFLGGGIYLQNIKNSDIQNVKIINSSVFSDQIASEKTVKDSSYVISKGGGLHYNQLFSTNSKISFKLKNVTFENCKASSGGALYINLKNSQSYDFQIENNNFVNNKADIGPVARILGKISTSQKNLFKKSSSLKNNKGYLTNQQIYFGYFHNEVLVSDSDNEFGLCILGTYLKNGGKITCDDCKEDGVCQGGYQYIYPEKEFWRTDEDSDSFHFCYNNEEACQGQTCKENYSGVLCGDCDSSQKLFKEDKNCSQCNKKGQIIFINILKIIATVAIVLVSAYSIKIRCDKFLQLKALKIFQVQANTNNQVSIVMKIFLAHFQILALGTDALDNLAVFFKNSIIYIGSPVKSHVSTLECLFKYDSENVHTILFKAQILGYSFSIISLIILLLIPLIAKMLKFIHERQLVPALISISVAYFINIQPGTFLVSLLSLNCISIEGTRYAEFHTSQLCSEGFYKNQLFPFHIIVILLLVVVVPLIIMVKLKKYHKQNQLYDNIQVLRKYGILYIELKPKFFYWEFVWMYYKILIVIIADIFQGAAVNLLKRVTFIIIVTVFYAYVIKVVKPYISLQVNNLSIASNLVLALSVSLLLIDAQNDSPNGVKFISIFIVIVANFLFLIKLFQVAFQQYLLKNRQLLSKIPIPFVQKSLKSQIKSHKKAIQSLLNLRKVIQYYIIYRKEHKLIDEQQEFFLFMQRPYKMMKLNEVIRNVSVKSTNTASQIRAIKYESFQNIKKASKNRKYLNYLEGLNDQIKKQKQEKKLIFSTYTAQDFKIYSQQKIQNQKNKSQKIEHSQKDAFLQKSIVTRHKKLKNKLIESQQLTQSLSNLNYQQQLSSKIQNSQQVPTQTQNLPTDQQITTNFNYNNTISTTSQGLLSPTNKQQQPQKIKLKMQNLNQNLNSFQNQSKTKTSQNQNQNQIQNLNQIQNQNISSQFNSNYNIQDDSNLNLQNYYNNKNNLNNNNNNNKNNKEDFNLVSSALASQIMSPVSAMSPQRLLSPHHSRNPSSSIHQDSCLKLISSFNNNNQNNQNNQNNLHCLNNINYNNNSNTFNNNFNNTNTTSSQEIDSNSLNKKNSSSEQMENSPFCEIQKKSSFKQQRKQQILLAQNKSQTLVKQSIFSRINSGNSNTSFGKSNSNNFSNNKIQEIQSANSKKNLNKSGIDQFATIREQTSISSSKIEYKGGDDLGLNLESCDILSFDSYQGQNQKEENNQKQ